MNSNLNIIYNGYTLLMTEAYCANYDNVEELLKKGADPNVLNGDGKTAFDICFDSHMKYLCTLRNGILNHTIESRENINFFKILNILHQYGMIKIKK